MNILLERPKAGHRALPGVRRLMLRLSRDERRAAVVMEGRLHRLFGKLGKAAGRAYREAKTPDEVTVTNVIVLLDIDGFVNQLRSEFERQSGVVAKMTEDAVNDTLRLGVNLPDHVARRIVAEGGRRAGLVDLAAQTRAALFRAIADGRAAGEGPRVLAGRVEAYVSAGRFREARTRAVLIARTETKYAQNASTLAVYRESDTVQGVIAYDNRTGHGDPDCVARDGQFYSFEDADAETEAEHPNGTLSWGPATRGA